ncbi:MAG: glycosyltransferase [Candidatus Thorarchaeota archaeon]
MGRIHSKILVLGKYDPQYNRVKVLLEAFRTQGFELKEYNLTYSPIVQHLRFLILLPRILKDALQSAFILVPYPGWNSALIMKVLSLISAKPIVFDAFISTFCTNVEDLRAFSHSSLKGRFYWLLDRISCELADVVLLDTNQHVDYFVRTFGLNRHKFIRAFVGVSPEAYFSFKQREARHGHPKLLFYGSFSPLQGIPIIVEAIDILRKREVNLKLTLIGDGFESEIVNHLISSLGLSDIIQRLTHVDYDILLKQINDADLCLGIFGESIKSRLVIPNKVYDYAALNKVFVTGNSRAMHELFVEGEDYIGCKFFDAVNLAETILNVINNLHEFRQALNPRRKIMKHATPMHIGRRLMIDLLNRIGL